MGKKFPEINTYLCHHQTEAGFEPGRRQAELRNLPVTTRPREQVRFKSDFR